MIVVSDTNILSSFAAGDSLPQLLQLFPRSKLVIPPVVQQELQIGVDAGEKHLDSILQSIAANQIEVLSLSAEEEALTYGYPLNLNEGERQAIAISQMRKATLLCNDKQAIRCCQQRRITVLNLVDLLRRLWVKQVRTPGEVRMMIEKMERAEGLVLSPRQMAEIFAQHEGSQ